MLGIVYPISRGGDRPRFVTPRLSYYPTVSRDRLCYHIFWLPQDGPFLCALFGIMLKLQYFNLALLLQILVKCLDKFVDTVFVGLFKDNMHTLRAFRG